MARIEAQMKWERMVMTRGRVTISSRRRELKTREDAGGNGSQAPAMLQHCRDLILAPYIPAPGVRVPKTADALRCRCADLRTVWK